MWFRYQNGVDAPVSLFMRTLTNAGNTDVQGDETITLRRRRVRKVTGQWDFWQISIGMDELYLTANLDFLKAWWAADRCYIDFSEDPLVEPNGTWTEITPPTGPLPITFPTGNKYLPSFSSTLYATIGD